MEDRRNLAGSADGRLARRTIGTIRPEAYRPGQAGCPEFSRLRGRTAA